MIFRAELDDLEDLAKYNIGEGARLPGRGQDVGRMYGYSTIGLAYNAVTNQLPLPLILMVMSIKITFFDNFVDVHLRPITWMRIFKGSSLLVSSTLVNGQKQSGAQNCRSCYSGIVCLLRQYHVVQVLVTYASHRMKTSLEKDRRNWCAQKSKDLMDGLWLSHFEA